ncbi:phosphoenolpyruvate--protein phosphotransferase [Photobacterium rosenbergii]|uniref:phosphoenolpyruvate--protein phosphotransferase n=1 Tax=Photobacterium rosenbergii TaxID=294936 RepID=UPI001C996CC1|nr:phosphoenolpyruvate--protein phosphotransferase [Photobacterium rosenbergii]MBY5944588.1 phosphoenolpyruvate--protein phosphotransferase [Photobacterium rosenbergii]
MKHQFAFRCELPNGIHARPATHLEKACGRFDCQITLVNHRNNLQGDAKSVLSLVGTDTLFNDNCTLIFEGSDSEQASQVLEGFIHNEFPHCDEALATEDNNEAFPLPQSLMRHQPTLLQGKRLASGLGQGKLVKFTHSDLNRFATITDNTSCNSEAERFSNAHRQVTKHLSETAATASLQEKEILTAHLAILNDSNFIGGITELLSNHTTANAILATVDKLSAQLEQSASTYLRERVLDIRDVAEQVLIAAYPKVQCQRNFELTEPCILLAKDLTPSQFIGLDKRYLQGLVLTHAGSTSHTVILARAFGIPTLSGITTKECLSAVNTPVYIDAQLGVLATDCTEPVQRYFQRAIMLNQQEHKQKQQFIHQPAVTNDGHHVEIAANIACSVEASAAFANGAEGIGLFRTEMLFMDRQSAPDENEQYEHYSEVLKAANGKPVIIRTMDIGGDKPIDYLNLPHETNPFLGYRAVRIYPQFQQLFRTQLRAILRASVFGNTKIMIPMIQSIEEIRWVKQQLEYVKAELDSDNTTYSSSVQLGIMVEVPSVAFIIDQFCQEVDFFSIGSNDMTQYLLAVDRDNDQVSHLYNSFAPAFLRMLGQVVKTAHDHGRWVGLCGELGADTNVLPLMVGAGLDEISMSAPKITTAKAALNGLTLAHCQQLFEQACQCPTIADVTALLDKASATGQDKPLLGIDCVFKHADFANKEEAVQALVGNLGVQGRTDNTYALEDDIWAREAVFSTGLGHGFAIPHTKSDNIRHSSISIAQLNKPIDWQSDAGDVDFIIMLTLNKEQGDQHMRIFSGLARKLIHQDFRDKLRNCCDEAAMIQMLEQELAL